MRDLVKQFGSTAGAAFAAACCAGASWALAALTAIGAGFLINDAVLIPLFAVLLGLSLWLLFRSARAHADLRPVYLAGAGAAAALIGLWTSTIVLFAGLGLMVGSNLPFGGTCALRGCDPKKVLVGAVESIDHARRMRGKGVTGGEPVIDWRALMAFKRGFTKPVPQMMEKSFKKKGHRDFSRPRPVPRCALARCERRAARGALHSHRCRCSAGAARHPR